MSSSLCPFICENDMRNLLTMMKQLDSMMNTYRITVQNHGLYLLLIRKKLCKLHITNAKYASWVLHEKIHPGTRQSKHRHCWKNNYKWKNTETVWLSLEDGRRQTAETSSILGLGHSKAETTKGKLERQYRSSPKSHGNDLGRSTATTAANRNEWRRSAAQSVFDKGWTKL